MRFLDAFWCCNFDSYTLVDCDLRTMAPPQTYFASTVTDFNRYLNNSNPATWREAPCGDSIRLGDSDVEQCPWDVLSLSDLRMYCISCGQCVSALNISRYFKYIFQVLRFLSFSFTLCKFFLGWIWILEPFATSKCHRIQPFDLGSLSHSGSG
jgi:hypothetical protein